MPSDTHSNGEMRPNSKAQHQHGALPTAMTHEGPHVQLSALAYKNLATAASSVPYVRLYTYVGNVVKKKRLCVRDELKVKVKEVKVTETVLLSADCLR